MRVGFITSDYPPRPGGISSFARELVAALAQNRRIKTLSVAAIQYRTQSIQQISEKLTILRMPFKTFFGGLVSTYQALQKLSPSVDILHSMNVFPIGFWVVLLGRYVFRKPTMLTFFGTDVLTLDGSILTKRAKGWTLRHADTLVTISESTRTLTSRRYGIPESRIALVGYTLPRAKETSSAASIRSRFGISDEDIVVLTAARLVKRKGVDDLVRAIAKVQNPRVKLLVLGDGAERPYLERTAKELSVAERVIFAGWSNEVHLFYRAADIFALASYFIHAEGDVEGLGVVMLEAAQHGLPVIGTNSGGIPETFIDGETGILVPERDVPALTKAIERLSSDKELRKRFGEAGKKFVSQKFDATRVAEEYRVLYEKSVRSRV